MGGSARGRWERGEALLLNFLQRHWEWQGDRRDELVSRLDVKMALDVARPSVVSKVPLFERGGGSSIVGRRGQIRVLESRGEVEDQGCWGLAFGGEGDDECLFRGMMWADNYWSDDKGS